MEAGKHNSQVPAICYQLPVIHGLRLHDFMHGHCEVYINPSGELQDHVRNV